MSVALAWRVADVATPLRSARQEAGLSIEELSARTRIKPAYLLALERGDYHQLPGEFFARAFLRTYARELHVPLAEVMGDYERAVVPAVRPTDVEVSQSTWRTPPSNADERSGAGMWTVLAIAAALALAVFVYNRPDPERAPESGAVGTSGAGESGAGPAPSEGTPTRQIPPPAETITIQIRPTRAVWVTGTADGKRALFRQIEAGETITLDARERLSFRVGDAGAFAFSLNGTAARPVGRDGEVREFTVSRENLRSYLQ